MDHQFVRITYPFADLSGLVLSWSTHCKKMAVYQHVGDETGKTHIHLAMYDLDICKKQLRNIGSELLGPEVLKGNKNCSFKKWDGTTTPLVYMTKGSLDPVFFKGFDRQEIANWKSSWVAPAQHVSKTQQHYSEFLLACDAEIKKEISDQRMYNASIGATLKPEDQMEMLKADKLLPFEIIRKRSINYVFAKHNNVWTPAALAAHRTNVISYCFSHGYELDKNWGKYCS